MIELFPKFFSSNSNRFSFSDDKVINSLNQKEKKVEESFDFLDAGYKNGLRFSSIPVAKKFFPSQEGHRGSVGQNDRIPTTSNNSRRTVPL